MSEETAAELTADFPRLSVEQVEAALEYYRAHRREIDEDMERRAAYVERLSEELEQVVKATDPSDHRNRDRWHERSVETFETLRLPLATSAAVLSEIFHLVGDHPHDLQAAWRLLRSGAFTVMPITDGDLSALHELMERYADRPMDFADATLVHLAGRESLTTVFTVDHDDFETYRIPGGRTFRVVPGRGPAPPGARRSHPPGA